MIEANEVNSTFYALRLLSHGLDTSEIKITDGEEYPASEFSKEEQEQGLKIIHSIERAESDVETKVAILKRKAEEIGIVIQDEVAIYIASRVTNNVRELERSLIRLLAHSTVRGIPISMELAEDSIRNTASEDDPVSFNQLPREKVTFYLTVLADRIEELANKDLANAGYTLQLPRTSVPKRASLSQDRAAPVELTPRQRAVLALFLEGVSTRDIARTLGISVKTVENHRTQVGERLRQELLEA